MRQVIGNDCHFANAAEARKQIVKLGVQIHQTNLGSWPPEHQEVEGDSEFERRRRTDL
jgi:hypothetical protein